MSLPPTEPSWRRDLIFMTLIGLLTIACISVSAELIARKRFYESPIGLGPCLDASDPAKGVRGKPNTVCHEKSLESDDIEYRFDSRGYRSMMELGPKAPDVYRIVLIGSSVAMGERSQFRDSPAAVLAARLSTLTGRTIEVYSQGMAWGFARNTELSFQDAIEAKPDLILWLVTPLDIARSEETLARDTNPAPAKGIEYVKNSILQYIRGHGGDIVIGQVLRHYLYEFQSEDQFVRASLQGKSPDDESGFLLVKQGPAWQKHWVDFAGHAQNMIARSRAAGVPMAVTFAPNRVQAAMISAAAWPMGYDPYRMDHSLKMLVEAYGGTFIELLPHYRTLPGSEHFYLALDGHPTTAGYAFLAQAIAQQLTGGAIPSLAARAAVGR